MFKFFKDVSREMRKVTWPKGPELVSYTITVVATVAFVAIFFAVVDLGISQILNNMPFLNN
ncbi:preprotein translocase subunit SecE [Pseudogracilibacillus sp. SO30301A]|uniref:preprotein translocase subunit SecE n=1 Tax=Pseudogracilibacillus sp. SO30301A TaxID=3098291 RepID=UPI00300E35C7